MKTKFSWTAFWLLTLLYVPCTILVTTLMDGIAWTDLLSIKNLLKELLAGAFLAFGFNLIFKPTLKRAQ